jgi:hypothetical protein
MPIGRRVSLHAPSLSLSLEPGLGSPFRWNRSGLSIRLGACQVRCRLAPDLSVAGQVQLRSDLASK